MSQVQSIRRERMPHRVGEAVQGRAGRSAKWIAKELGIEDWRVVHRALMGCGAYRF